MIKALSELGANVDQADKQGLTPVMVASNKGHVEAVRTLHALGASIDSVDNEVSRLLARTRIHAHTSAVTSL